jgi:hypothetical protein
LPVPAPFDDADPFVPGPVVGQRVDAHGPAVVVEASQVGRRGRRTRLATGRDALYEHGDLAHALGIEVRMAILRLLVEIADERARLFELFGRRRVDERELLEQLRMVADGILQLGDSLTCNLVEGDRLFFSSAAYFGAGLRRLGP